MNKDKKNLIYIIVAFAFILLFPLIPAPDGLNVVSMEAIGLFIGIMIMWNFVGTDWPSFLCMALVAIFGRQDSETRRSRSCLCSSCSAMCSVRLDFPEGWRYGL